MIPAPLPPNEPERLAALRRLGLLDTPAEQAFDDLVQLAAQICEVPVAMVSLVDEHRQWFKARIGVERSETPREIAFCAHAILAPGLFVVPDASKDERFADNPLVVHAPHARFYAGVPVRTTDGFPIGTLCVMDTRPRQLSEAQAGALLRLARQVELQIELRRGAIELASAHSGLEQNEARLRSLLAELPTAVFECDTRGRCSFVNPKWCELTGLSEGEARGMGWLRAVHPEDRTRVAQEWTQAAAASGGFRSEYRYLRPDGEVRWAEGCGIPRRAEDGSVAGVIGTAVDITARRTAEAALRESEARLAYAVEATNDGLWDWHIPTGAAYFSPRWCSMLGYEPEEVAGHLRSFEELVHPEDMAQVRAALETHFRGETEFYQTEPRMRAKDGSWRWIRTRGKVVERDAEGRPLRMTGTHTDITDARRAREILQREHFLLTESIENAPIAMAMLDTDMRYVAHSRKWLEDYGLIGQDLIGRSHYEVFPHIPDRWKALHARALAGEALSDPEDCFEGVNGELAYLRWAIHPWRHSTGAIGGMIMVTDVVTDLVRARQQAIESTRLKADFLASMSHEIRTPMNGVIGMTGLLLDTPLTQEQRECAETIRASSESLLTIINDILDFSKIEADKLDIEPVPFDVHRLVEDVGDLLMPKIQDKQLELGLRYGPGVPLHVVGDPGRIRQILTNLVGNAVKFTERGHVLVEVTRESGAAGAAHLRFEVRDTGIGIAEDKLGLVFEKFIQGDSSTTRRFGGTGLGLAISRQLVRLMGGTIGVNSRRDEGSAFWFSLPLPEVTGTGSEPAEALPPGRRVLVVDDVELARRILTEQLLHLGAIVDAADSGEAALARMRAASAAGQRYDAVLLDFVMPGMDGEALAKAIAADPALAGTSMVMVSGMLNRPREEWLRELGVVSFLKKPVRLADLAATVRLAIARHGQPAGSTGPAIGSATASPGPTAPPEPGSGPRVLVVDDNSVNQKVAARMLGRLGCRVDVAANGLEAVGMVRQLPYAVVFMDCMMPEMDGYEATAAIRAMAGPVARTPIVAMTANAMQGDREHCLAAGMDDYLSKPVRQDQLQLALDRWAPEQQPASSQVPPVDVSVLEGFRQLQEEGQPDVIIEFIDLFLGDLPARRKAIRLALSDGDAERVRASAHALKTSAAYIGAAELARLCKEMEMAARAGDLVTAVSRGAALEAEADRAADFLSIRRAASTV